MLLTPPKKILLVYHTSFHFPFISTFATTISFSFDLYQSNLCVAHTQFLHPSRSISHHLYVPLSLPKSVISFFYFDNFFFLCLLLYPAIFFAFKSSSPYRCFSLSFFFFHLCVTVSFLHSLSVCLCLSNYLLPFVSLSLCSAVLLLSVTPLTLSM